jgi:16S rRNA (guanine527-N7)-methyltransferase
VSDPLDEILRRAQDLGFLGPGSVEAQRRHAQELCRLALEGLEAASVAEFLDLGSGGGLPGLVLATHPGAPRQGTLLDRQHRRTRFLQQAVEQLELADRIDVVTARAEDAARDPAHRERYGLLITRGFAAPPVTAECAVAFLAPGARLVVSEPPEPDPARWSPHDLAGLGLTGPHRVALGSTHAAILQRTGPLDARWPRKRGIPQKRPLW